MESGAELSAPAENGSERPVVLHALDDDGQTVCHAESGIVVPTFDRWMTHDRPGVVLCEWCRASVTPERSHRVRVPGFFRPRLRGRSDEWTYLPSVMVEWLCLGLVIAMEAIFIGAFLVNPGTKYGVGYLVEGIFGMQIFLLSLLSIWFIAQFSASIIRSTGVTVRTKWWRTTTYSWPALDGFVAQRTKNRQTGNWRWAVAVLPHGDSPVDFRIEGLVGGGENSPTYNRDKSAAERKAAILNKRFGLHPERSPN
jgi:hypothetical protein